MRFPKDQVVSQSQGARAACPRPASASAGSCAKHCASPCVHCAGAESELAERAPCAAHERLPRSKHKAHGVDGSSTAAPASSPRYLRPASQTSRASDSTSGASEHELPARRVERGECAPIRAFCAQAQPVIAIGRACEANAARLTSQRRCQEAGLGQARSPRARIRSRSS